MTEPEMPRAEHDPAPDHDDPPLEFWVTDCALPDLLAWLGASIGPLTLLEADAGDHDEGAQAAYEAIVDGGESCVVVITERCGDGSWTSILVEPNLTPWEVADDAAYAAAAALNCTATDELDE